ncbi:MAG: RNA methyltransferase [Thermoanaerobacteraceae bacterium]|nr:RNA methyltransferase [Thermoanaerobacteraceae bacterium]
MQRITSFQNEKIKEINSLHRKKYRQQKGLYFVEGQRMVEEALQFASVRTVVISEEFADKKYWEMQLQPAGTEILMVPEKLFKKLADTENPQGILAVVKKEKPSLDKIISGNVLVAAAIQDPGNLGTLIRTAVAAGCAAVITTRGTVDVYNPKVLRSTMGAIFKIPVLDGQPVSQILAWLKNNGLPLIVADVAAEKAYYDVDLARPFALLIGNENLGPEEQVLAAADQLVRIPMLGKTESLNAAIAGSIILYESLRQRLTD